MPTVEAIFDRESLISTETLAVLLERNDHASARRLLAHFGCIAAGLLVAAAMSVARTLWSGQAKVSTAARCARPLI